MSADNALLVRKNSEGKVVVHHIFMSNDIHPAVDGTKNKGVFDTLEEAIGATSEFATNDTEYGYVFGKEFEVPRDHGSAPQQTLPEKPKKPHEMTPAEHRANREKKIANVQAKIDRQRAHIRAIEKNIAQEEKLIARWMQQNAKSAREELQ